MKGRLAILGFAILIAGLALLVYADPALNAVVIGQSTSTTTTATTASTVTGVTGSFAGGGGFVNTGTGGTGASVASRLSSSSTLSTDSIIENSAGLALALVGLVVVVADMRVRS